MKGIFIEIILRILCVLTIFLSWGLVVIGILALFIQGG